MATAKTKKQPANHSEAARPVQALPLMFTVPPGSAGLLSKIQIAGLLGIGLSKFKEMLAEGRYPGPTLHIGKLPRWTVAEHNEWIAAQAAKARKG